MARQIRRTSAPTIGTGDGIEPNAGSNISDGDAGSGGPATTDDGTIIIDPAAIGGNFDPAGGSDTGGAGTAKRGRKPRAPNAAKKAVLLDVSGVEALLFSIHGMLAGMTKTPELALGQTEAKAMAEALGKVSRHYDVSVQAKTMDWTNLLMVAGMVYGPRIVAVTTKRRAAPAEQAAPRAPSRRSGEMYDIPGVGPVDLSGVN